MKEAMWPWTLLSLISYPQWTTTLICCDNMGAISLIWNPVLHFVTSCNTHVTLLTNRASSEPVTSPVTSPALVHPRTHQPLKHHSHSFSPTPIIPRIQSCTQTWLSPNPPSIFHFKFSPGSSSCSYLVPVPVPCSDIAFLCFPSCTHRFPVFQSVSDYNLF